MWVSNIHPEELAQSYKDPIHRARLQIMLSVWVIGILRGGSVQRQLCPELWFHGKHFYDRYNNMYLPQSVENVLLWSIKRADAWVDARSLIGDSLGIPPGVPALTCSFPQYKQLYLPLYLPVISSTLVLHFKRVQFSVIPCLTFSFCCDALHQRLSATFETQSFQAYEPIPLACNSASSQGSPI